MFDQIDELAVNAVRTLSIDAVQRPIQGTPVYRWEPLRWPMRFGQNI